MHMDVPPPQLGQLDFPVGVTIQYLSLKGFFHSCSQKVSQFCVSEILIVLACLSNQLLGQRVQEPVTLKLNCQTYITQTKRGYLTVLILIPVLLFLFPVFKMFPHMA